jgi:peptidoglycan/LPS O-acetylase OafA/YrhL
MAPKTDVKIDTRVRGLDTIRFFLAIWVTIGHFWVPLGIDESSLIGKITVGIYTNLVNGPAAVIVFFVISGFCIHYPYRHHKELLIIPYFSSRHLRIWIPIVVAVLCGIPLGVKFSLLERSILWSLVAEEIYYLIYPMLLSLRRKIGWQKILFFAYVGASAIVCSNPTINDYPSYGPYLTWLLGLPCWLLGCCLAERADRLREIASIVDVNILKWRLGAWLLSFICIAMNFLFLLAPKRDYPLSVLPASNYIRKCRERDLFDLSISFTHATNLQSTQLTRIYPRSAMVCSVVIFTNPMLCFLSFSRKAISCSS